MNYLDVVIATSLLYGIIKGFSNGLIKEVTSLLALLFAVYMAINFSAYLNPKITSLLKGFEKYSLIISFVVLFGAAFFSIKAAGYIIDKFTKIIALGFVSRLLGGAFGFFKMLIVLIGLTLLIKENGALDSRTQQESLLFNPINEASKIIIPEINKHKKKIIIKTNKSTEKAKEILEKKLINNSANTR